MTTETMNLILAFIIASVAVVVWLVRLEGRVNYTEKRLSDTNKALDGMVIKHDALDSKTVNELSAIKESLARIEGYLGVREGFKK